MVDEKISSWLLKEPTGGVILILDRCLLFFFKIFFIFIKISLGIILGKRRRDQSGVVNKIRIPNHFSPSFFILLYLYKVRKSLRLGNPNFIKIYIPRYNYKIYCPANKIDFKNLTVREDDILEHFFPKEGDTVIDVGAHIGKYTLLSSKRVGPNGKVVAIEVDPSVLEILNKNIKLNQLTNVTTLNYAVYSKETKIKLYVWDEGIDTTIYNTVMTERAGKDHEKFVEVKANTLDNMLHQNGINAENVNWIKIDVEGAELEVLKGATNVLSKSKNIALLIEIHNVADGKNFYKPIMDLLGSYKFKIEFEYTYEDGEKHIVVRKLH